VLLVILAVAVAARAGDLNWLYLGGIAIALGSVGTFFALRSRTWLVAVVNLASALAGVWMVVAVTTFEGS
jgi:hypothetical protein